jgi:hypothetical protein
VATILSVRLRGRLEWSFSPFFVGPAEQQLDGLRRTETVRRIVGFEDDYTILDWERVFVFDLVS